ncbi:hypothetical protein GCM10011511_49320 [Puia dinghuensis]|uniref:Uncharacterized protein n=2 Tax=Puia dinghuensis TaxID=1792502 RepID=A0A8J2UHQ7_9BACT|nr:hypothetical protein GCM10011511_49320 [Puia dinghuensis]
MLGIYNLAFGNVENNGGLDDELITNNGDRDIILATVAQAVDKYTQRYPRRWIFFKGNTPAKTRLYRMAIGINLRELLQKFEILAVVDGNDEFLPFQRSMIVDAFMIKRRINF